MIYFKLVTLRAKLEGPFIRILLYAAFPIPFTFLKSFWMWDHF